MKIKTDIDAWHEWELKYPRLNKIFSRMAYAWIRTAFVSGWQAKRAQVREAAARCAADAEETATEIFNESHRPPKQSQSPSARYSRMRWAEWCKWRMGLPTATTRTESMLTQEPFKAGFDAGYEARKRIDIGRAWGMADPDVINWFRDSNGVCWVRQPKGATLRVPPLTPNEIEKIRKWIETRDFDLDD